MSFAWPFGAHLLQQHRQKEKKKFLQQHGKLDNLVETSCDPSRTTCCKSRLQSVLEGFDYHNSREAPPQPISFATTSPDGHRPLHQPLQQLEPSISTSWTPINSRES